MNLHRENESLTIGLVTLPFALWLALDSAGQAGIAFYVTWRPFSSLVLLIFAFAAAALSIRFYRERLGVLPASVFRRREIPALFVAVLFLVGFSGDAGHGVSGIHLMLGLYFLLLGHSRLHVLTSMCIIGSAFMPLFGGGASSLLTANIVTGLAWSACTVIEHFQFTESPTVVSADAQ